jgi:predicted nucleotidyltransferase
MDQPALLDALRKFAPLLWDSGVVRLFMFGPRARGDGAAEGDLDLFIEYDPVDKVPSLFQLMQIEEDMAKALGFPVTITTRNALHPLMRESVEREAVRVF